MIFNPKNQVEQKAGEFILWFLPYLNAMTYKFHVEKAREIGKYTGFGVRVPRLCLELDLINLNLILYRN